MPAHGKIYLCSLNSISMSKLTQEAKTPQDIFLKDLRTQTHESHQALEDNAVSKALLSEEVSLKDYQAYLSRMYGLKKGLEANAYPLLAGIFPEISKREKAYLIKADLLKTGMSEEDVSRIPVKQFSPLNEQDALGMMYVLEGSTLGGRILYKHVNKALGLDAAGGASFFNGYGDQTGPMWKEFVSTFTNYAVGHHAAQQIIDGAKNTFDAVGEWLSGTY